MSKNIPTIITGCQRSGTTLLNLILDSHPAISSIDEDVFKFKDLAGYLNSAEFHPFVSFKLPRAASEIQFLSAVSGLKVIWCIRDYRDVVASMMDLHLPWNGVPTPWAGHPAGALQEIQRCEVVLRPILKPDLKKSLRKYRNIYPQITSERKREHLLFSGALCWRLKQELLRLYKSKSIEYQIVQYERLIQNPELELRALLSFLNIPWHEDVLSHHRLHSGISIGGTYNNKAIDSSNSGKWEKTLNADDMLIINRVCLRKASQLDYG